MIWFGYKNFTIKSRKILINWLRKKFSRQGGLQEITFLKDQAKPWRTFSKLNSNKYCRKRKIKPRASQRKARASRRRARAYQRRAKAFRRRARANRRRVRANRRKARARTSQRNPKTKLIARKRKLKIKMETQKEKDEDYKNNNQKHQTIYWLLLSKESNFSWVKNLIKTSWACWLSWIKSISKW